MTHVYLLLAKPDTGTVIAPGKECIPVGVEFTLTRPMIRSAHVHGVISLTRPGGGEPDPYGGMRDPSRKWIVPCVFLPTHPRKACLYVTFESACQCIFDVISTPFYQ